MRDIDAALVEYILYIPQRQWVPDIHHHCETDDLWARLEVAEDARVAHAQKASGTRSGHKPILF